MQDRESVSPRAIDGSHVAPCDDGTAYRPPLSECADVVQESSDISLVRMARADGTPFLLRVGREYLQRVLNLISPSK